MITLAVDALIAIVKLTDRGLSAIEKNVHHLRAHSPEPVAGDAQAAGAGDSPVSAAGTGGHPEQPPSVGFDYQSHDDDDRPLTSDLLEFAAEELLALAQRVWPTPQPFIEAFSAELRERAQELVSQGD